MKLTTEFTQDAWLSGDYTEERRPEVRATIGNWTMQRTQYYVKNSGDWNHGGGLRSALFQHKGSVRELRNIKSIKYSRSIETDAATCTITLFNTTDIQDVPNPHAEEFDYPGWFTPNRGQAGNPWDYSTNSWKNWFLPDRVIKTFEGYGVDRSKAPEVDPHQYPSGVWLIDDVDLTVAGEITLTCRDLARLLLSRIMFPPVVPFAAYPLYWEAKTRTKKGAHKVPDGAWKRPAYEQDSNDNFAGYADYAVDVFNLAQQHWMDGNRRAVDADGSVHGHRGKDAFDANPQTSWLSAGSQDAGPYEFIQGTIPNDQVTGIKLNLRGGPYRVYVSLRVDGKWKGAKKIPARRSSDSPDPKMDIPYVQSFKMSEDDDGQRALKRVYKGVDKIRFTFSSMWDSGIGQQRTFRTGVYEAAYCSGQKDGDANAYSTKGNYADYTDIIKWLLGWGGFYWPRDSKVRRIDGIHELAPQRDDPTLPLGAIWGDLESTATVGQVKLAEDIWDKKPLMDGINAVRDTTGFDFWIDETGGAIWRLPNVWKKGCYVMPTQGGPRTTRTTDLVRLDDRTTLIDMSVKLSSRNVRDRIFVSDAAGKFGAVSKGYNPVFTRSHLVGGWTDSRFANRQEARRMADLIAIRQSYLYRTNSITIAANPAIQIDDQVVVRERMTGDEYLHRVIGITSDFDIATGKWTYQLETQWLGVEAFTKAQWRPAIGTSTHLYLQKMGKI